MMTKLIYDCTIGIKQCLLVYYVPSEETGSEMLVPRPRPHKLVPGGSNPGLSESNPLAPFRYVIVQTKAKTRR